MSQKRILIAEDELLIRTFSAEALADAGYEVLEAPSAAEALEILGGSDNIDLLFTDIQMPGSLDGLDLARLVHQHWPRVKLLLTSGNRQITEEEIPENGHFMLKPYRMSQLHREVDELLGEGATGG